MTDCPKEAPQANDICLQSCEKKIKRSRWDIQTDTRVSDATIDSVSGASGVAKILETSQGCVNFSLTEKRKDEEGSVAFNYPRLLPLDTPYLRMEVIGRLQLALWGEKALHQAALKEQQKEKEKIVYVTQLVCAVLLFLIQSRQSLSQKSSSSHCDDDDDDENVSQSIDGQYSEKVADRLNPLFLYQEKSCKDSTGTFQEDSETDTTWSVFAESYQKIFNKAWTMCTDYINSPSGEDHVSQDLQAFLQRIECAKPFAPPENISPEENYIFRGLLFENQTLRSSLVSCEKKCDRLELVVEQCRKQISIYLSRDPATPQVIDLDHFLMVESLKYDAPEVFLSCVPKLIRSLQQLESNNTMKTCLLNEALECIDSLKKESCEKDLLIHRLEHRLSTLTEQAEHIREIPKANIQKFCQLEEHINQLHLEKAELLERVNEISLSRVRSETEIEALLRRKCSSLESEKKDLQERKKEVELLLIELKNQNAKLESRNSELEESYKYIVQEVEKEKEAVRNLLHLLAQQRQNFSSSEAQTDNSFTTPSNVNQLGAVIKQRDHLTAELDELSGLLEEKLTVVSKLEERCRERDERCIAIVEESFSKEKENEKLDFLVKQLTLQNNDQNKCIESLNHELEAQLRSFHSFIKEQEISLKDAKNKDLLHKIQQELCEKTHQILELKSKLEQVEEKYKEVESSNRFLLNRFDFMVKADTKSRFLERRFQENNDVGPTQISQFLQKKATKGTRQKPSFNIKEDYVQQVDSTATLQLELDALRRRFLCTLCNERWKNAFIKKCGHSSCDECLKNTLLSRNRKCPHCNQKYQAADIQRIFGP